VGDRLVSAGTMDVSNSYAFVFFGTFPGGSLEVHRNGESLRIDGLESGPLGISLEDRAPEGISVP